MKNKQEEIDDLIRKALSKEEAAFYDELGEQNLTQMVGGLFQGKMRWIAVITMIVQPIMFICGVYFAIKFFHEQDLRIMIQWGACAFFFLLGTSYLKIFHWMMIKKNALLREMKRMELQITMLAGKITRNE